MPSYIRGTDRTYWREAGGAQAKWSDFRSRDYEYEQLVYRVADLQGTVFRRHYLLTYPEDPVVACLEVAADPADELPSFGSSGWPSLGAALAHAGRHSRWEGQVLVQVFLNWVEIPAPDP